MHDEKKTREVDQLGVIRELLERGAQRSDTLEAKLDASRAEGQTRGAETARAMKSLEADVHVVRREVQNLSARVTAAEADIRDLRDNDSDVKRFASEADLSHQAALGGAIAHVRTLESSLEEIRENDEKQNRVQGAICAELGLDYEAVASKSPTIAPPGSKPKKTTLGAMARENKGSLALGVVTTLGVLLQIILEMVRHAH